MAPTEEARVDRLLLVDDNPTNLQVLFQSLEAEGYELLVAQSGEEAIDIAQDAQPQLILLDINMPGIDGYETCRRLKADPATRNSAIIFLSARGDVRDKVQGLQVGAVDYIGKPFQFEEVLARVRKHLEAFHQHQALQKKTENLEEQLSGGFPNLAEDELKRLLAAGESENVEFKSTLRWNLHTSKPDKRIENASLKTVAAYLNSSGGILFVGVDDQGVCLGLESDKFASEDKLLLFWNGLIKQHLGVEIVSFLRSKVHDVEGVRILVVQCLPSSEPVFLRRDNDEVFFIRTGNGTQPLKPSEILSYVAQRDTSTKPSVRLLTQKNQRFGQYTIDEKIGAGAMGVVYRGHHAMLKRPAAIKLLDPNRTNEQSIARFEREVQLTSQLRHPNTIDIYDYGRTAEGMFYYVMEYLDGITLDELVKLHGPQPDGRVIHILRQVCGCLAEAHGVGLIHRDIKPANIMVNQWGTLFDFVKLLDFGLVKAVDDADEVALTTPGAVTGTPMYLSPEAIEGRERADARSDLYSLGVVAYHLLAGQAVFLGHSVIEICMMHMHRRPDPPSQKRGEPVSADLEGLILKCLEKDPTQRPQSAQELRNALAACEAAQDWSEENAVAWWSNAQP